MLQWLFGKQRSSGNAAVKASYQRAPAAGGAITHRSGGSAQLQSIFGANKSSGGERGAHIAPSHKISWNRSR